METDTSPIPAEPVEMPLADHGTAPGSPKVVGGVAALLADRLDVDALWVRIAFVVLALTGGIGVVVYLGLWLALVRGSQAGGSPLARSLGGVVLVLGVPLLLGSMGIGGVFDSGSMTVVALLAGLALALWRPSPNPGDGQPRVGALRAPAAPATMPPSPSSPAPRAHHRPPRSPLGRATLGAAVVVAAAGALIDQANGGRFHPEQWLGAASVVCGLGLVVGMVRGRARWLVVPAAAFAVAGFVAGVPARLGIGIDDFTGDRYLYVDSRSTGGDRSAEVGIGEVQVDIPEAPAQPATLEATVGFGAVRVVVADDVTVRIDGRIDHGELQVNGQDQDSSSAVVGPEGAPDVIVEARVGRGSIEVVQYSGAGVVELEPPTPPTALGGFEAGDLTGVADGVSSTADGWFVLGDGEAVIDAADQVVVGQGYDDGLGGTVVDTVYGPFRLLPRSLLLTPWGEVLDLQSIRDELAATATTPPVAPDPIPTSTPGG